MAAPRLWNELPLSLKASPTLESFQRVLKTHLLFVFGLYLFILFLFMYPLVPIVVFESVLEIKLS